MSSDLKVEPYSLRAPSNIAMMSTSSYVPPDPTRIETSSEALDFWSRTLAVPADKIRRSVEKVGPVLEAVKDDLGIGGVG